MLRCPERHEEGFLVLSTGEMLGRMVRSGVLACPTCGREYPVVRGVVQFSGGGRRGAGGGRAAPSPASRLPPPVGAPAPPAAPGPSGPGGCVVLLGCRPPEAA